MQVLGLVLVLVLRYPVEKHSKVETFLLIKSTNGMLQNNNPFPASYLSQPVSKLTGYSSDRPGRTIRYLTLINIHSNQLTYLQFPFVEYLNQVVRYEFPKALKRTESAFRSKT